MHADAVAFAKTLGTTVTVGDPRATHRRPKRCYKTRVRTPSKLDPHVAAIKDWLAAEEQLTAIAIVGRLSEKHPDQFGTKQHSIVQRLLKALRKKAAEKLLAQELLGTTAVVPAPGLWTARAMEGPTRPQPLSSSALRNHRVAIDQSPSDCHRQWRHLGNILR